MPERITAILSLLEEGREAQAKANEILAEVRVDVAGMKRMLDAQQAGMADLRKEQAEQGERLRAVELALAQYAHAERDLGKLFAHVDKLDTRVRVLEGNEREAKVVTGATAWGFREVMKLLLATVIGAGSALVAWAMSGRADAATMQTEGDMSEFAWVLVVVLVVAGVAIWRRSRKKGGSAGGGVVDRSPGDGRRPK